MRRFALLVVVVVAAVPLYAQSAMPEFSRDPVGVKQYPAAPRVLQAQAVAPAAMLGPADAAELAEVLDWNASGRLPMKNGFTRAFAERLDVHLVGSLASKGGPASHAGGVVAESARGLVWSATFKIENAHRVRLHLENVHLPEGAVLWVYGGTDEPTAFDRDLVDADGALWTPSVRGPVVHLEVEIPSTKSEADAATFVIREALELVGVNATAAVSPEDVPSCLVDVNCRSGSIVDILRAAIAHLEYVKGGSGYVCTGGLVNDKVSSTFVPYLLTANHCFDTQSSASSLEAYWDYRSLSCGASLPTCCGSSRTLGSTLLATNATSDFTFVQMNSVPGGRTFLGWTGGTQPSGTLLYRVSHPFPDPYVAPAPQMYSRSSVNTTFGACTTKPRPSFIYSTKVDGGLYGGSSGSPVVLENGQIVGQLFGACGPDPSAGCNVANATVDGAFGTTFASIQQYINAEGSTCTATSTIACLNNNRFGVKVDWKTSSATGQATAIKYTADSGFYWFFNAENIEIFAKVLNGCAVNSRYWVFSAAATDVEYTLSVTDSKTGTVKTYFHAGGTQTVGITDTNAFATCP